MKNTLLFLMLLTVLCGALNAQSLLFQEDFNLTAGTNLNGQNSWTQASAGSARITIASYGLTYNGYAGSGIGNAASLPEVTSNGDRDHHTFSSAFSGTWYLAFLAKVDTAKTGDYFIGYFYNNAFRGRVYIKAATGGFQFGLVKTSTGTPVYSSTVYSLHTTYLLVLKYKFNTATTTDDTVSLFVNPVIGEAEPATPAIGPLTDAGTDVASATLAIQSRPNAGAIILDGIRLATSWNIALPPPPFYYTGTGALNDVLNWGTEANGTGTHPANFTSDEQSFYVTNADSIELTDTWTVTGSNSKVVIVSGKKLAVKGSGNLAATVDVSSGGILYLTNNNFPTFGSTVGMVEFKNPSGFTLASNLTLPSSSGTFLMAEGNIDVGSNTLTVNGNLECGLNLITGAGSFILGSGATLRVSSPAGITLSAGEGNIQTATRSYSKGASYTYKGSGTNLVTGDGLPDTVSAINLNLDTSADILTLTNSVVTTGNFTLSAGRVKLGNNNLLIGNPSGGTSACYIITDGTGFVKRSITTSSTTVKTFHVGSLAEYRKILVTFPATSGLGAAANLNVRYISGDPGSAGYPTGITTHYAGGSWVITMDTPPVNAYTLDVETAGMTNVSGYTTKRVLKRPDSGTAWATAGTAVSVAGTVVTETGCTGFSEFVYGGDQPLAVSLSCAPEGYYDAGTGNLSMRDTFKVYLADITSPYASVDSATVLIDSLTRTATAKFNLAANGTYYIVVKGRNIVETWSKSGGETLAKGSTLSYNFTSAAAQAYGSNLVQKGSAWCMYSGDVNQDGIADFSDLSAVDNDQYNFVGGYVATDLTGDNFVDFSDLSMCDNNQYNFVGVVKPGMKRPSPRAKVLDRQHNN